MQNIHIYVKRIGNFVSEIAGLRYEGSFPLQASYIYSSEGPIPYKTALEAEFRPLEIGDKWGELWGSAWFRFKAEVPPSFAGHEIVALIDIGGEACLFEGGEPVLGLTSPPEKSRQYTRKRLVPLFPMARGGEKVSLLVEGAANQLLGARDAREFYLEQAELTIFRRDVREFYLDLSVLYEVMLALAEDSSRFKEILSGLNTITNLWQEGEGFYQCSNLAKELLSVPAPDASPTVWSVGHGHLDLAWLWPLRESRRKAGRTFSTALRLIEEYPEYRFGASQAQLYQWVMEDYPSLFERIKEAVREGTWECQGCTWVEPDTNLPTGESLIRQCLYGKAFFRKHFNLDIDNLWLPDAFGFSAALPQILAQCGVKYFISQKLSWSETNDFPHHSFRWRGIDGSEVLAHFLPAEDYNVSNNPGELIAAAKRYHQHELSKDFLNLYGAGDGGGGPSRRHIEFGRRMQDCLGAPRFRFAQASNFCEQLSSIPKKDLPVWTGELYLELHRGTYTSQAKIKEYNRRLEEELKKTEFIASLAFIKGAEYPALELESIWKLLLLHQFHDILPGTSITEVYEEAHESLRLCIERLTALRHRLLRYLHPESEQGNLEVENSFGIVYNSLSWEREVEVTIPETLPRNFLPIDSSGEFLPVYDFAGERRLKISLPSMGCRYFSFTKTELKVQDQTGGAGAKAGEWFLENEILSVRFAADGSISSIFDKLQDRELLSGPANRLLVWEDKPYSWEAWDISHYYRETKAKQAELSSRRIIEKEGACAAIEQGFVVGNSAIEQKISLRAGSRLIRFDSSVDWKEERKLLKMHTQTSLINHEASYEIQFGLLKRPTHSNTPWDQARFEVPGHRFADLSQPDYGFALVNDSKYGYRIQDGQIELSLLRSPKDPDPTADIHLHRFSYAFYPHPGDLAHSDVLHKALEYAESPLVLYSAKAPERESLSCFSVKTESALRGLEAGTTGSIIINTVKQAEDGSGIVLRCYEALGKNQSILLEVNAGFKQAWSSNVLEEREEKLEFSDSGIRLNFRPFEIKTIVLEK